ncbi:hypothetical protein [Clostridium transplantifaecale]|uniref:hypothetical protein n=1 Tax=Clostridium transplantifaecale TaxID=2479838 RepID=UPI000F6309FA|nr:hypothetical protein [Clostridium transplantifaecale]
MDNILQHKNIDVSKTCTFLSIYARYLYHEKGLKKSEIIEELNHIMNLYYPRFNPVNWSVSIEKYAGKAGKYPLCECKGIWITENELQTIEEVQDKVLGRLAFTLLCLAKFRNYRNPNNNNWVNYSNGEIFDMACINTTAFNKDIKFNRLLESGLIEYAKKVNNLNIRVMFVDDNSRQKLLITDFRKLGYEWKLYKGEKYIRCTGCGILVKRKTNNQKYCKDCAYEKQLERNRDYKSQLLIQDIF